MKEYCYPKRVRKKMKIAKFLCWKCNEEINSDEYSIERGIFDSWEIQDTCLCGAWLYTNHLVNP